MNNIKLYVDAKYTSPYAMSAFVALMEKQQQFDVVEIDLGKSKNLEPGFSGISLTSRVPVLEHDGFFLSESSAIDEYIDEVFTGVSLYPTNTKDKARARQIQAWLRSDLMPIRTERSTECIFYKPSPIALSDTAQQAVAKLFSVASSVVNNNSGYVFNEWSIVDVDLTVMLNRLILNGDAVPEHLVNYAKHNWQRPSVQAWVKKLRPPI